ncbi:hypothetical protein [Desulfopila sp. IMCC35008]|uniref:hypothetical protein n=1 Tax=Desulfopila sp. IMCC35008 TaxID=2653858 RepID=UPI0013D4B762|nr:hypothetical protein [Desulfopila sp. IMCC35008]
MGYSPCPLAALLPCIGRTTPGYPANQVRHSTTNTPPDKKKKEIRPTPLSTQIIHPSMHPSASNLIFANH